MIPPSHAPQVYWLQEADTRTHDQVYALLTAVVDQLGAVGWLATPTAEEAADWLESELDHVRAGTAHLAIATSGGAVCGLGILSLFHEAVFAHNAQVRKVMTHPELRGNGVARAVLLALQGKAAELKLENLVLDVRGNNHGAMALYESLGWTRYAVLPDFIAVGNERFDQVKYVCALPRPADAVRHGQTPVGPGSSHRRD